MAIKKTTELDSGLTGDYWTSGADYAVRPGAVAGTLSVSTDYRLWMNKAACDSGKAPLRRIRRVSSTVNNLDPKLSEIVAALDAEVTKASVPEVLLIPGVVEVRADPAKGIEAVKGRPAVPGTPPVAGGKLEGGTIV